MHPTAGPTRCVGKVCDMPPSALGRVRVLRERFRLTVSARRRAAALLTVGAGLLLAGCGGFTHYTVSGSVRDSRTGGPVESVEVVLTGLEAGALLSPYETAFVHKYWTRFKRPEPSPGRETFMNIS